MLMLKKQTGMTLSKTCPCSPQHADAFGESIVNEEDLDIIQAVDPAELHRLCAPLLLQSHDSRSAPDPFRPLCEDH